MESAQGERLMLLELKPPNRSPAFQRKLLLPGFALLFVPVEVDLNAPKTKKFRAGEATCDIAPCNTEFPFPLGEGRGEGQTCSRTPSSEPQDPTPPKA